MRTEIVLGPDGQNYFCIFGNTFEIKGQLSGLGFRWNGDRYCWYMSNEAYSSNPRIQARLSALGVPVGSIVEPPPQPKPRPAAQPKPTAPREPVSQQTGTVWYLSTNVADGKPVVASKVSGGWNVVTEDDQTSIVPDNKIQATIKSVKDPSGKNISSTNPDELFEIFHSMKSAGDEAQPAASTESAVPGRISPERLSQHQKAIETSFVTTDKSIMINALAGTGKTTTLRHLASFKKPEERWLYLVFNKKNQVEASSGKSKFPNGVEVSTSHSFLGKILGKSADLGTVPNTDLWPKGERITAILDEMMEQDQTFPLSFRYAAKRAIKQIASMAKACAINPSDKDAMAKVNAIVDQYSIDCDLSTEKTRSDQDYKPMLVDKALDLLHYCLPGESLSPQFDNLRDHDDTLWYTAINGNLNWPSYDVVLADEVQDFNSCQTIMLQKLAQAGARIVAVGDKFQAIYMFRGADADAFAKVQNVLQTGQKGNAPHDLPVNYRSGRKIIEYVNQNTHVKNLVAGKDFDGLVTEGTPYDQMIGSLSDEQRKTGKMKEQTAFIARTNSPLVGGALDLMKDNIDFVIIGRDFSKELIEQVEKVTGRGRFAKKIPIANLADTMEGYIANLEQKWAGKISKAAQLKDMKVYVVKRIESRNWDDCYDAWIVSASSKEKAIKICQKNWNTDVVLDEYFEATVLKPNKTNRIMFAMVPNKFELTMAFKK